MELKFCRVFHFLYFFLCIGKFLVAASSFPTQKRVSSLYASSPTPSPSQAPSDCEASAPTTRRHSCSLSSLSANLYLEVVAGVGISVNVSSSDGSLAVDAAFKSMYSIWTDLNGNSFIVDKLDNRVRVIDAVTGMVNTVVGTGVEAFTTSGGAGLSVSLCSPWGVVGDHNNQILYVSDKFHVWKYDIVAGTVDRFAGGVLEVSASLGDGLPATLALLDNPAGMWLTSDGDLYIAECGSGKVRVVLSSGIITTVAGGGLIGFGGDGELAISINTKMNSPVGVYVDSNGALYIADKLNVRVRCVNPLDGIISTFAGGGIEIGDDISATAYALAGVGDVRGDIHGNIYISDTVGNRVLRVDVFGIISTFLGSGSSGLNLGISAAVSAIAAPLGIWIDEINCLLYEVESGTSLLKKSIIMSPSGCHSSFDLEGSADLHLKVLAGTGVSGFSADGCHAVDAKFQNLSSVWADFEGNIYLVDNIDNRVRVVDKATGTVNTLLGTGSSLFCSTGGLGLDVPLFSPTGVVGDIDENCLYVSDRYHIWKYNISSGLVSVYAGGNLQISASTGDGGLATDACLNDPTGMWLTADGTLFIAESAGARVRSISHTGIITTVAGCGDVGFGGDGDLAVSETVKLNSPCSVYVNENGALFIADQLNFRVRTVTGGIISTCAGGGLSVVDSIAATSFKLGAVSDVRGDLLGNIFISDTTNHKIFKVDSFGLISTFMGSGSAGINLGISSAVAAITSPLGMWIDQANSIFFYVEAGLLVKESIFICPSSPPVVPCPTLTPVASPSVVPTTSPSSKPAVLPIILPQLSPTVTPTKNPTASPTALPTKSPTAKPTVTPTPVPSKIPTVLPSAAPTTAPTVAPSVNPTHSPSTIPTAVPTFVPTVTPSECPTPSPTALPTRDPTTSPSATPSNGPTVSPTADPSACPTFSPSCTPTVSPTVLPSVTPGVVPSLTPTNEPSVVGQTNMPTVIPSIFPTLNPTTALTVVPSAFPIASPTVKPTVVTSNSPSATPTTAPVIATANPTASPVMESTAPVTTPFSSPTTLPVPTSPSAAPNGGNSPSTPPNGGNSPSDPPVSFPASLSPFSVSSPSSAPFSPVAVPSVSPFTVTNKPIAVTHNPTAKPVTATPSVTGSGPSSQPTGQPTSQPSGQPSQQPSIQPSSSTACNGHYCRDRIEISGRLILDSCFCNSFSSADLRVILQAIEAISVKPQTCDILSTKKLSKTTVGSFRSLSTSLAVTANSFEVKFLDNYEMLYYPKQNTSFVATSKTQAITDAVEQGTFQAILRHLAASRALAELFNVSSTKVYLNTTIISGDSTEEGEHSTPRLSAGAIAGIAVGCFVGIVLFFIFIVYLLNDEGSKRFSESYHERIPSTEPGNNSAGVQEDQDVFQDPENLSSANAALVPLTPQDISLNILMNSPDEPRISSGSVKAGSRNGSANSTPNKSPANSASDPPVDFVMNNPTYGSSKRLSAAAASLKPTPRSGSANGTPAKETQNSNQEVVSPNMINHDVSSSKSSSIHLRSGSPTNSDSNNQGIKRFSTNSRLVPPNDPGSNTRKRVSFQVSPQSDPESANSSFKHGSPASLTTSPQNVSGNNRPPVSFLISPEDDDPEKTTPTVKSVSANENPVAEPPESINLSIKRISANFKPFSKSTSESGPSSNRSDAVKEVSSRSAHMNIERSNDENVSNSLDLNSTNI
jgi:hypothetical protein